MKSYLRSGAVLLALVGSVGIAAAQQSPAQPAPTAQQPSTTMRQGQTLQLTAAQKSQIYKTVIADKSHKPAPAGTTLRIGAKMPSTIELSDLPGNLASQIPAVGRYKFVVAQNQVVLVDPATSEVVEIIRQ